MRESTSIRIQNVVEVTFVNTKRQHQVDKRLRCFVVFALISFSGGGGIRSTGLFCSLNFGRSIYLTSNDLSAINRYHANIQIDKQLGSFGSYFCIQRLNVLMGNINQ